MGNTGSWLSQVTGTWALWGSWLLGPLAWFLHLNASYLLRWPACEAGSALMLHLVTLAALPVALLGVALGWWTWREAGRRWPDAEGGERGRSRFLGMGGVLSSGISAALIVAQEVATLMIEPCR